MIVNMCILCFSHKYLPAMIDQLSPIVQVVPSVEVPNTVPGFGSFIPMTLPTSRASSAATRPDDVKSCRKERVVPVKQRRSSGSQLQTNEQHDHVTSREHGLSQVLPSGGVVALSELKVSPSSDISTSSQPRVSPPGAFHMPYETRVSPPGVFGTYQPGISPPGIVGSYQPRKSPAGAVGSYSPRLSPPGAVSSYQPGISPCGTRYQTLSIEPSVAMLATLSEIQLYRASENTGIPEPCYISKQHYMAAQPLIVPPPGVVPQYVMPMPSTGQIPSAEMPVTVNTMQSSLDKEPVPRRFKSDRRVVQKTRYMCSKVEEDAIKPPDISSPNNMSSGLLTSVNNSAKSKAKRVRPSLISPSKASMKEPPDWVSQSTNNPAAIDSLKTQCGKAEPMSVESSNVDNSSDKTEQGGGGNTQLGDLMKKVITAELHALNPCPTGTSQQAPILHAQIHQEHASTENRRKNRRKQLFPDTDIGLAWNDLGVLAERLNQNIMKGKTESPAIKRPRKTSRPKVKSCTIPQSESVADISTMVQSFDHNVAAPKVMTDVGNPKIIPSGNIGPNGGHKAEKYLQKSRDSVFGFLQKLQDKCNDTLEKVKIQNLPPQNVAVHAAIALQGMTVNAAMQDVNSVDDDALAQTKKRKLSTEAKKKKARKSKSKKVQPSMLSDILSRPTVRQVGDITLQPSGGKDQNYSTQGQKAGTFAILQREATAHERCNGDLPPSDYDFDQDNNVQLLPGGNFDKTKNAELSPGGDFDQANAELPPSGGNISQANNLEPPPSGGNISQADNLEFPPSGGNISQANNPELSSSGCNVDQANNPPIVTWSEDIIQGEQIISLQANVPHAINTSVCSDDHDVSDIGVVPDTQVQATNLIKLEEYSTFPDADSENINIPHVQDGGQVKATVLVMPVNPANSGHGSSQYPLMGLSSPVTLADDEHESFEIVVNEEEYDLTPEKKDIKDANLKRKEQGVFKEPVSKNINKATEIVGDGATQLVGDGATQLVGDGATQLVGDGVTQLVGDGATQLVGDGATQLVADGVTQLVGDSATELAGGAIQQIQQGCVILEEVNDDSIMGQEEGEIVGSGKPVYLYGCKVCGLVTESPRLHRSHIMRNHTNRRFCHVCGVILKNELALLRHTRSAHEKARDINCLMCGKSFTDYIGCKTHMENVHINKNHCCTWEGCGRKFKTRYTLAVHLRTHTGEKPYGCYICEFRCAQHSSLAWHLKFTHNVSYNSDMRDLCYGRTQTEDTEVSDIGVMEPTSQDT